MEDDMALDFDELFNPDRPSRYEAARIMAEPAHPGDLMRELIDETGLNITRAAQAIRVQRTHLSAMLSGDKPVTIETAIKFEAAFGGPAPTVIHGMSDLYESAKALRSREEIVAGIVRVTEECIAALPEGKSHSRTQAKRRVVA
jgi:addiction module HigA family antidote